MLTEKELQEMKVRCEKATSGWTVHEMNFTAQARNDLVKCIAEIEEFKKRDAMLESMKYEQGKAPSVDDMAAGLDCIRKNPIAKDVFNFFVACARYYVRQEVAEEAALIVEEPRKSFEERTGADSWWMQQKAAKIRALAQKGKSNE